jgi:hypothetical protein
MDPHAHILVVTDTAGDEIKFVKTLQHRDDPRSIRIIQYFVRGELRFHNGLTSGNVDLGIKKIRVTGELPDGEMGRTSVFTVHTSDEAEAIKNFLETGWTPPGRSIVFASQHL